MSGTAGETAEPVEPVERIGHEDVRSQLSEEGFAIRKSVENTVEPKDSQRGESGKLEEYQNNCTDELQKTVLIPLKEEAPSTSRETADTGELKEESLSQFEGWREVFLLGLQQEGSNEVHSTKYTTLSFLPRAFALQFRRVGNIYFTVIVFIMLLGSYTRLFPSPQKPWGNLSILVIIFFMNMLNEGLDDLARRRKDDETNSQKVNVYSASKQDFEERNWGEVKQGDLLLLEKNKTCPADVLVLTTSDSESEPLCYVQTANVDGETYLKKRMCKPEVIQNCPTLSAASHWLGNRRILVEPPSQALSSFKAVMLAKDGENFSYIRFSSENVILRGSELRNTDWVWVAVLYTGKETKTLLAQGKPRIKQSKVDRMANKVIITVLVMLLLLLVASCLIFVFAYPPSHSLWYLMYTHEAEGYIFPSWLALLLTYVVLYRQILPILLYAVQDGLNTLQAKYIGWDLNMLDESTGKFASCNTTSLVQEIGQIRWVFSDKTGTLTRNEMRLVACSVDGKIYGRYSKEGLDALAKVEMKPSITTRICFSDMLDELKELEQDDGIGENCRNSDTGRNVENFLRALSLCHTVLVETDNDTQAEIKDSTRRLRRSRLSSTVIADENGSLRALSRQTSTRNSSDRVDLEVPRYNAESPDEEALVFGAASLGHQFAFTEGQNLIGIVRKRILAREANGCDESLLQARQDQVLDGCKNESDNMPSAFSDTIQHDIVDFLPVRKTETWEVLAINPFTSDRKRMSVVYQEPAFLGGRIILFCKGADNQMLSVSKVTLSKLEALKRELYTFSENGLRTLVVAQRVISEDEFKKWSVQHSAACELTGKSRREALDNVACLIELDLEVLGTTAVEDRLQDGVPQTIALLRAARINFWLITGDKVETAINIGRSASLLTEHSNMVRLTAAELGIGDDDSVQLVEDDVLKRIELVLDDQILEATARAQYLADQVDEREHRGISGRLFDWCNQCKYKKRSASVAVDSELALVVDGEVLHHILTLTEDELSSIECKFLELARRCSVVIACRTSPGQKAQLVKLVKENVSPTPVTLAIGDGANDVPMIEVGHVGVGISGKEGTHAVNAADFTISQFKYLAPLLFVHGRLGYIRIGKAISLTFYGNLLFTFVSFYYNFICSFSGTPAFSNLQYVVFQAFIAVPVFVLGGLDRDSKDVYSALKDPRCYDIGRLNLILNPRFVDAQILRGLAHGAIAFFLVFYNDYDSTFIALSVSLFIVVTFVLTAREAQTASSINWFFVGAISFNMAAVFIIMVLVVAFNGAQENLFDQRTFGRYFWNQLFSTIFLVTLLDYIAPLAFAQFRRYSKKVTNNLKANMGDSNILRASSMTRVFKRKKVINETELV